MLPRIFRNERLEFPPVRTWISALVLVVVVAAAIAIKLILRRRAPEGGWFTDSSHGEGTFGVLGTMFTVMLAFIIFVALESYQRAREGSSVEAVAVTKLHSTAELFPAPSSDRLQGGLVCYARAVIDDGWRAMRNERYSDRVQFWVDAMAREFRIVHPQGVQEEAAYGQWLEQEAERRDGRRERIAEAPAFVPLPLWFVLIIGAGLTIGYMCIQADRREGVVIQSVRIGSVTTLVTAGLLVVAFLDHPYADQSGSVEPTEMRRTLELIDDGSPVPCDEGGIPRPT